MSTYEFAHWEKSKRKTSVMPANNSRESIVKNLANARPHWSQVPRLEVLSKLADMHKNDVNFKGKVLGHLDASFHVNQATAERLLTGEKKSVYERQLPTKRAIVVLLQKLKINFLEEMVNDIGIGKLETEIQKRKKAFDSNERPELAKDIKDLEKAVKKLKAMSLFAEYEKDLGAEEELEAEDELEAEEGTVDENPQRILVPEVSKETKTPVLAVYNFKGGVAKTTTVTSLAGAFAARGIRVGIIDADPQGNTSSFFYRNGSCDDNTNQVPTDGNANSCTDEESNTPLDLVASQRLPQAEISNGFEQKSQNEDPNWHKGLVTDYILCHATREKKLSEVKTPNFARSGKRSSGRSTASTVHLEELMFMIPNAKNIRELETRWEQIYVEKEIKKDDMFLMECVSEAPSFTGKCGGEIFVCPASYKLGSAGANMITKVLDGITEEPNDSNDDESISLCGFSLLCQKFARRNNLGVILVDMGPAEDKFNRWLLASCDFILPPITPHGYSAQSAKDLVTSVLPSIWTDQGRYLRYTENNYDRRAKMFLFNSLTQVLPFVLSRFKTKVEKDNEAKPEIKMVSNHAAVEDSILENWKASEEFVLWPFHASPDSPIMRVLSECPNAIYVSEALGIPITLLKPLEFELSKFAPNINANFFMEELSVARYRFAVLAKKVGTAMGMKLPVGEDVQMATGDSFDTTSGVLVTPVVSTAIILSAKSALISVQKNCITPQEKDFTAAFCEELKKQLCDAGFKHAIVIHQHKYEKGLPDENPEKKIKEVSVLKTEIEELRQKRDDAGLDPGRKKLETEIEKKEMKLVLKEKEVLRLQSGRRGTCQPSKVPDCCVYLAGPNDLHTIVIEAKYRSVNGTNTINTTDHQEKIQMQMYNYIGNAGTAKYHESWGDDRPVRRTCTVLKLFFPEVLDVDQVKLFKCRFNNRGDLLQFVDDDELKMTDTDPSLLSSKRPKHSEATQADVSKRCRR